MAALSGNNPTLLDLAKGLDPDSSVATVIELLNEDNEILDDMVWMEGNLPTGNQTTTRTGIPAPTWRKMYGGVQPTKATTAQVIDLCGNLEALSEVDVDVAKLSGDVARYRMQQVRGHMEGIKQEIADTLFYGNTDTEPEAFTGLAPRFSSSTTGETSSHVISGGGSGSDNASVWLVNWDENTCHGIYPRGQVGGLQDRDWGEVWIEDASDGSNTGRMLAFRWHLKWAAGLTVKDWRHIVRIGNIDKSALTLDAQTGANLVDLMTQALERVQSLGGRPAFYCNRTIKSFLRRQIKNSNNVQISMDEVAGKHVLTFDGIPVRRCDALAADEAAI